MLKGEKKSKALVDSPERLNRLVEGTKIEGDITTESNFRLDGEMNGAVKCKGKFVLGEKGVLNGSLSSLDAEIEGFIEGDVVVENLLILKKTAVVQGTVSTSRLIIEDGAQLGGTVNTGELPKKQNSQTKGKKDEGVVY